MGSAAFAWRVTDNGIVSKELAQAQLELFRRAIRGRLNDNSLLEVSDDTNDELWSIGQHHGLMTPLLDWTYSPFVGLFFAFAKEDQEGEEDNPYRAVYVINKTFVEDNEECPDIRVLEPRRDDHGRLVNQAGLFTFSPFDSTIENKLIEVLSENETIGKGLIDAVAEHEGYVPKGQENEAEVLASYICKIYIKNEDRQGCLKALRKMNVHHASLFPDLLGASDYCNLLIEEKYRKIQVESLPSSTLTDQPESTANTSENLSTTESSKSFGESNMPSIENIIQLLKTPESSHSVEPGRLEWIAKELSQELEKYKLVDWTSRETVHAKMRNIGRVILRKLGYPEAGRAWVIDKLIEVLSKLDG